MSENNTELSEMLLYKDFHKERRSLFYYLFIYLIIHLTYVIFIKGKNQQNLNNIFSYQLPINEFNNMLNNIINKMITLKDPLIFESGSINIPILISFMLFLYIGVKIPSNMVAIMIFNIVFQLLLIFMNNSGDIITYPLINTFAYKFGNSIHNYFYGDKYLNSFESIIPSFDV